MTTSDLIRDCGTVVAIIFSAIALFYRRSAAGAARESAAAAQRSAAAAEAALAFAKERASQDATQGRSQRINELVNRGIAEFPRKGSLLYTVGLEPTLTDAELEDIVRRVLAVCGRDEAATEAHVKDVLKYAAERRTSPS
jgi:hypothetical protein